MLKNLLLFCLFGFSLGLEPITSKHNKLFVGDKEFRVKGIAYQPRGGKDGVEFDALAEPKICERDIKMFKDMGINVIRVYQVDPKNNHDKCMEAMEKAGMYLALDLPDPNNSINREKPDYTLKILNRYKQKVDQFDKYNNVGFYIAGNEISNTKSNTNANAFVKAGLRDIKAYVQSKKHKVLVGYANLDNLDVRKNINDYFNCGSDEERADFMGMNTYSWCGGKIKYDGSPYEKLTKELEGYSIPVFMTEFGCNRNRPREFVNEISAIFGPMGEVFSGGIVYEYSSPDGYGIVETDSNHQITKKDEKEIDNITKGFKDANMDLVSKGSYNPKGLSNSKCPAVSSTWESSEKLPLPLSDDACDCAVATLECVAQDTIDATDSDEMEKKFSFLCNKVDCKSALSGNAKKGEYGAMSGCSAKHQLSWALNENYKKSGKQADACKQDGVLQTPKGKDMDSCFSLDKTKKGSPSGSGSDATALLHLAPTSLFLSLLLATLTLF